MCEIVLSVSLNMSGDNMSHVRSVQVRTVYIVLSVRKLCLLVWGGVGRGAAISLPCACCACQVLIVDTYCSPYLLEVLVLRCLQQIAFLVTQCCCGGVHICYVATVIDLPPHWTTVMM